MLRFSAVWGAALLAGACLLPASVASASTKCLCNNGTVAHSMSDGEDACQDACDTFGGGRVWQPEDAAYEDGGDNVVRPNPRVRQNRPAQGPASRR